MQTKLPVCVMVGRYTSQHLCELMSHPIIGTVHRLLVDPFLYPEKSRTVRVELELREKTNLGELKRPANLFEMIWYAIHQSEASRWDIDTYEDMFPFEGFDEHLELMGDELATSLTVPVLSLEDGRVKVGLTKRNRLNARCHHQLVCVDVRMMRK